MNDAVKHFDFLLDKRERERTERQKARHAREQELRLLAVEEMLLVMERLVSALRYPDVARGDMQAAERHFERAYEAVLELDPVPEEEPQGPNIDHILDDPHRRAI